MVINNLHGKYLSNIDLEIDNSTCIIGNEGEDKKELERVILQRCEEKCIRIIPKFRINIPLTVREVLDLYQKRFGKRNEFLLNLLNLDDKSKITDLSEFERFKVELAQIAFGNTKLLVVENLFETFEEQLKDQAVKLIVKLTKLANVPTLFFFSGLEFSNVCERIYIIYGGKLLEYSLKNYEYYHPYTLALQRGRISVGKVREKIEMSYIGEPSTRGCPYHSYCEFAKKDKQLFKLCISMFPAKAIVNKSEVYCWLFRK